MTSLHFSIRRLWGFYATIGRTVAVILLGFVISSGARAQTIAGSVNLTNYGGLCDGVHPTNTAFVSAIAALGSAGGTINVPAGMCLITTNSLGGFSGTWPVNSTTVTITSSLGTAGITVGMTVSSTSAGIQTDSVVTAVNPSSITISKPTTSAQTTGVSLARISHTV